MGGGFKRILFFAALSTKFFLGYYLFKLFPTKCQLVPYANINIAKNAF